MRGVNKRNIEEGITIIVGLKWRGKMIETIIGIRRRAMIRLILIPIRRKVKGIRRVIGLNLLLPKGKEVNRRVLLVIRLRIEIKVGINLMINRIE
jgi:hypothetical protein